MASAERLYRLVAGLSALGLLAVGGGLITAASKSSYDIPAPAALAAACRRLAPSGMSLLTIAVLALALLAVLVVTRATASAVRQLRADWRLRGGLQRRAQRHTAGIPVVVVEEPRAQAFCAGLLRPRVYLSSGALARLSPAELEAVLAHERHHLERRDPLRLLVARVLADALFFLPSLRRLADRYGALSEVAADQAATRVAGPSTVASALLTFNQAPAAGTVVGIAPERVDQLLGDSPRWRLPASLFLGAAVTLAGLTAAVVAVASLAGSQLDLAMLVAQSCMALVGGAALAGMALGALVSKGRDREWRPRAFTPGPNHFHRT